MPVDPLNSRGMPATHGRVAGSRPSPQKETSVDGQQDEAGHSSGDSVALSDASRALVSGAGNADAVPQGTLSPARMREVLRRLADGFYDSSDVRAEVARRARPDIGLSRPE